MDTDMICEHACKKTGSSLLEPARQRELDLLGDEPQVCVCDDRRTGGTPEEVLGVSQSADPSPSQKRARSAECEWPAQLSQFSSAISAQPAQRSLEPS